MDKLTHPNLKVEMHIWLADAVGVWHSEAHKSSMIMFQGGGILPAAEDVETISRMIESRKQKAKE